jgi:hypothetical protein
MKSTNVSAQHIDTCLSDYIQDHHNRDGELLVGIYPHGQSRDDAALEAMTEARAIGDDRLPEDIYSHVNALTRVFHRALRRVDLRYISANGTRVPVGPDSNSCIDCDLETVPGYGRCDTCNDGEHAQVWLLLTWETV